MSLKDWLHTGKWKICIDNVNILVGLVYEEAFDKEEKSDGDLVMMGLIDFKMNVTSNSQIFKRLKSSKYLVFQAWNTNSVFKI